MVSLKNLKQLRAETGISISECKKALEEASDNLEKAKKILREKGQKMVKERAGKGTTQGIIASYIHPGAKIGVLLELDCETDFVARSEEFQKLAHELCLQVVAARPVFREAKDISQDFLDSERKIYQKQFEKSGKPEKIISQIIEGKLAKYKKSISLLSQPWVKDETKTIQELINEYGVKFGEKIAVKRFARYEI